jgi:hypothetical protein
MINGKLGPIYVNNSLEDMEATTFYPNDTRIPSMELYVTSMEPTGVFSMAHRGMYRVKGLYKSSNKPFTGYYSPSDSSISIS